MHWTWRAYKKNNTEKQKGKLLKGNLLCIKGDDKDGGDDLATNSEPEDENRVVNMAQLSENQN